MKVGDTLFANSRPNPWKPESNKWDPKPVTIKKVGRKWATYCTQWGYDARVNIETLEVDGARVFGRLWRSEAEWLEYKHMGEVELRDNDAWKALWNRFRYSSRPADVYASDIEHAMELLGLWPEKPNGQD